MAWHPHHENLLTTGGFDGTILYWLVGQGGEGPAAEVRGGHGSAIWSLAWHPAGHMCSGSNDNTSKFWCRNRPGRCPGTRRSVRTGGDGGTSTGGVHDERVGREGDQRGRVGVSTGGNRRGKTGRRRRAGNRPRRQSRAAAARAAAGEATSASTAAGKTTAARAAAGRAEGDRRGGRRRRRRRLPSRAPPPPPPEGRAERGAPGRRRASRRGWGPNARRDPRGCEGSIREDARGKGRERRRLGLGTDRVARRSSVCRVWWKAVGRFGRMRGWQPRGAVGVRRSCSEDRWRGLARETNAL